MHEHTSPKINKQSYYNLCNKIVQIPLTYGEERSRNKKYPTNYKKGNIRTKRHYFLRRLDNRAPFLHKRNVRRYNPRKVMIVHVDALFATRQIT